MEPLMKPRTFLVYEDFDIFHMKEMPLPKQWLRSPRPSKMLSVTKGEVVTLHCSHSRHWWLKVTKRVPSADDTVNVIHGKVPSTILVPVLFDASVEDYFSLDKDQRTKLLPIISDSDRKYFPKMHHYYDDLLQPETCRVVKSSSLSALFYSWVTHYVLLGYRRYLCKGDLWAQPEKQRAASLYEEFRRHLPKTEQGGPPLFTLFLKMHRLKVFLAFFCKFFQDLIKFVNPFMIKLFIDYSRGKNFDIYTALLLSLGVFLANVINCLLLNKYYEYVNEMAADFRSILVTSVYSKLLKVHSEHFKEFSVGFQSTLVGVDSYTIQEAIIYMNMLWSMPFQIVLSVIYLWFVIGKSTFVGLSVLFALIPINFGFGMLSKRIQTRQMVHKDKRIKFINSVLNGIKLVKLYAWEDAFHRFITEVRRKEIGCIATMRFISSMIFFVMAMSPSILAIVTFVTFIHWNGYLDATTAFVSLSLFNILRYPVMFLPDNIRTAVAATVSYKRFLRFLSLPEIGGGNGGYSYTSQKSAEDSFVRVNGGSFSFSQNEQPFLSNINLSAAQGELHIIIGHNGAGKTSLLQALVEGMRIVGGSVEVAGKLMYVPQQAWIRNTTLRENILFGQPFDVNKYSQVVNQCELGPDISLLPFGDMTEIGERGVNLSGGQKQRVSLARAVYSDSCVFLMDDPFSALDKGVGNSIFKNVVSKKGLLKDKVRILVTHNEGFLNECDQIHFMKNGSILFSGTYEEHLRNNSGLKDFLSHIEIEQKEAPSDGDAKTNEISLRELSPRFSVAAGGKEFMVQERAETGRVGKNVYWEYIKSYKLPLFLLLLICLALSNVANIGNQFWLAHFTSANIYKNNSTSFYVGFMSFSVGQAGLLLFAALVSALGGYFASSTIHWSLLQSLFKLPLRFFETTPIGRLLNAFSSDISVVDNNVSRSTHYFLNMLFVLLITITGVAIKIVPVLIGVAFLAVVYFQIQLWYIQTSRQLQRLESISRTPILSLLVDTFHGLHVIKSSEKQHLFVSRFSALVDYLIVPYKMNMYCNRWLATRLEIIASFLVFFSAITISWMVLVSALTSGTVGFILNSTTSITQVLTYFIRSRCDLENHLVSVERIRSIMKEPYESEAPQLCHKSSDWPPEGKLEFDAYSCRYGADFPIVLNAISFSVSPRQKVGIVGRTGSGKSSLLLSLFRMIERVAGFIYVDGVDIHQLPLEKLRKSLTIIPQDPFLFDGTLRDNIDPTQSYNDDEIWSAIELSQLKNFVSSHQQGLSYHVAQFGSNLSAGEKQLICLARALLKRTKILILDEATANVDLRTDRIIQEVIKSQFCHSTVLTVAHRIDTVINYDKILVLDSGRVVEFDSPDVLRKDETSRFYSLVATSKI